MDFAQLQPRILYNSSENVNWDVVTRNSLVWILAGSGIFLEKPTNRSFVSPNDTVHVASPEHRLSLLVLIPERDSFFKFVYQELNPLSRCGALCLRRAIEREADQRIDKGGSMDILRAGNQEVKMHLGESTVLRQTKFAHHTFVKLV